MTRLAFERLPNERERDEGLLENESRIEPEHAVAEAPKRAVLARIGTAALLVHGAIDFHDELGGSRDEVGDVATKRHLALEAHASFRPESN